MSTRTRVVLRGPGLEYTGAYAVKKLIELASPKGVINFKFPPNWNEMHKRDKLQWLSQQLPADYKLHLFQEPRETRLKQSLYHSSLIFNKKYKPRHPKKKKKLNVFNDAVLQQAVQGHVAPMVPPWAVAQPVVAVAVDPRVQQRAAIDIEARQHGEENFEGVEYLDEEPLPPEEL